MPKTQIVFLLLPHLHLLDLAGAEQVFIEAIELGADFEIRYCSFTDSLSSSTFVSIGPVPHFSSIHLQKNDFIIIPGTYATYLLSEEFTQQKALFDWLNKAYQQQVKLCSICTGAYVLAQAGLLNGRKCTTHWKYIERLQKAFPMAQVVDNMLFTEEDNILTSAGLTSGIDLALHLVAKLQGDLLSYKVAREMVVYMRRPGHHGQQSVFLQYRNHIHSGIHKVQDWLQENLHQKATLDDLAELACMSTRNLTRIFRKETGISINEYITLMRVEKIKELRKNPNLTRLQIAQACGLSSDRQVSRISPTIRRKQFIS
ncbi:MAG: DJ-1/PfpI family protein [Spirosomataceae bacterium]